MAKRELDLGNVKVEDIEGINFGDSPDFVDAYITAASFKDTGKALTDAELDVLNDDTGFVYEAVLDWIY